MEINKVIVDILELSKIDIIETKLPNKQNIMELWQANKDMNVTEVVTLDDIFEEAELVASNDTNKILYINPQCAQESVYNMEFYLSGAQSEVAKVTRAILRRVDEEIINKENTDIQAVVSAIIEANQNQTWFARLRTRLLNIFRRETSDRQSAMQNHTTNEYSCIKCGCFGKLFRSNRTRTPSSDSSVVRVYSDWSIFFTESVIVKAPGSWGWRPLRTRRRRREPN